MKRTILAMVFACMIIGTMVAPSNAVSQPCPPGYYWDWEVRQCVPYGPDIPDLD